MEQSHHGSGDNVGGNKSVVNKFSFSMKFQFFFLLIVIILFFIFYVSRNEITGIKGNGNNDNNVHISNHK